ncbi:hypothetical protein [Enterobacter asburiae]|uniref:hypothetical protein n=1 Tax=Enterobacter asburiae TaxID=61645 RepID=UPI0018826247|nr:hypothetical protein [Enterobacter asburiae]MBE8908667.1 hypothetical protein [Enterobacter asburiae]
MTFGMRDHISLLADLSLQNYNHEKRGTEMTKQPSPPQATKSQIYRSVASSTAIETGESVQKIEQQLKRNQSRAKIIGLAR